MDNSQLSDDYLNLIEFVSTSRGLSLDQEQTKAAGAAIHERISQLGMSGCDYYRDHLQAHPQEMTSLLNSFFSEKGFFFNENIWETLKPYIQQRILERSHAPFRAWLIGCRHGQEAFGLAIGLSELLASPDSATQIKVFATDVDEDKLATARQGSYDNKHLRDIFSPDLMAKYISASEEKSVFKTQIRRSVIFGKHDVTKDPAITRMDLIVCRQVLPFLTPVVRARVSASLLQALVEGGLLVLDSCERLPEETGFQSIPEAQHVYQNRFDRTRGPKRTKDLAANGGMEWALMDTAFETSPNAVVCVDGSGLLAAANANARSAFGLYPQDIGRPLQDLELSYRPIELRSLIDLACKESREVTINRFTRHTPNAQSFDLRIRPIMPHEEPAAGVLMQFQDVTELYRLQDELTNLNQQLHTANEELQSAHEELETTNEELQSTNEELETTNAELQSTNEELETMNEELQSTNEELEFSNRGQRELAAAIEKINQFLQSILANMPSCVIVLDTCDNVLIWSEQCEQIWGVRASEVKGQKFRELDIGLPVQELAAALEKIKNGQSKLEEQSVMGVSRLGRAINCLVKVMPFAEKEAIILIDVDLIKPASKKTKLKEFD